MGYTRQYAEYDDEEEAESTTVAYQSAVNRIGPTFNAATDAQAIKNIEYDVSYESSLYLHYFQKGPTPKELFQPGFDVATLQDPTTKEEENWVSFFFNSNLDGKTINSTRPDLNLVVALDVSGSMSCAFKGEVSKLKVAVAKESLDVLMNQLRDSDSFGLVIFNDQAKVIQPLQKWKTIDKEKLKKDIAGLRADGGTNISRATSAASGLFNNYSREGEGGAPITNRVFFLTDMEIEADDTKNFITAVKKNSEASLWSTVVGIGIDLTQQVIYHVCATPGGNYCNTRNTASFKELMDTEFGFLVTPTAFNIEITLQSDYYEIMKGFGAPEVNAVKQGGSIKIATEFPSNKNEKNETRAGIFLLKIAKKADAKGSPKDIIKMKATWDDLQGIKQSSESEIRFGDVGESTRKGVLLIKYTDFLQGYIAVRKENATPETMQKYEQYRKKFTSFVSYFRREMKALGDESLQTELQQLMETAKNDDIPVNKDDDENSNNNNNTTTTTSITVPTATASSSSSASGTGSADGMCCICLAVPKTIVFQPCKHLCTCVGCSAGTDQCPICRTKVEEKLAVFL